MRFLEYQAKLAEDLAVSENFDETKNSLMRELRELKVRLIDACKLLTQAREKKGFRAGPGYTEGASRSQF